MTDTQTKLEDGAAAYKRRHPDTPAQEDGGSKPAHQAGRDAYARRHGNRAGRDA